MKPSKAVIHKVLTTCFFCKDFARIKRLCKATGKKRNPFYFCKDFKEFK